MLTFAKKYSGNIHSQNGEDFIIEECVRRINPKEKTAIEFGAPSFYYCSNTAHLSELGWKVQMFDLDENVDARIKQARITPDNVNHYIKNPTVLSIDVDNDDYHIWKAYNGSPDIVIIEINSGIEPPLEMIPGDQGASYTSMVKLGIEKGYFLVAHTGNLIFVKNCHSHLFPELEHDPIGNHHLYFNRSFL